MKTYATASRSWTLAPFLALTLVLGSALFATRAHAQTLLANYTFSNSSNIGQDSSGNGYTLAAFKTSPGTAPTQDTTNYPTSPAGTTTSADFTGTGVSPNYVTLGTNSPALMTQLSGAFTVSCSIDPGAAFTGANEILISTGSSTAGNGFSLSLNSSGYVVFSFFYSGGSKAYTTTYAPTLSAWTQLTATDNGTSLTIYENGTIVGSAYNFVGNVNGGSPIAPTTGLALGSQYYGSAAQPFNGSMANVAIFSGALTATQVASLYTNGVSAIPEPAASAVITSVLALAVVGLWRKRRRG